MTNQVWDRHFHFLGVTHYLDIVIGFRSLFDEHWDLSEDVLLSLKMRRLGRILFDPEMVA
jgi:hypothetical protein